MSESRLNFGYRSNNQLCSCGKHEGIGAMSPEQRAATAARMRDTFASMMPQPMTEYLKSWEASHGRVAYRMDQIGTCDGDFVKGNKGQPLIGPVYLPNSRERFNG